MRACCGGLPRFGNEGIEARVAVQGFQVGIGFDLSRRLPSEIDGLIQMPERLFVSTRDSGPAGEVIPSFGNLARLVCFANCLDCFAEKSLAVGIPSFAAEEDCLLFETFQSVRMLRPE